MHAIALRSPTPSLPATLIEPSLDTPTRVVIAALIFVTGLFTGMDALRFGLEHASDVTIPDAILDRMERASHLLWYLRSILGAAIVPLGARSSEARDLRLQLGIFALILVADWLIILQGQLVAGVALFMLVQLGWAYRHTRGLRAALRTPDRRRAFVRVAIGCGIAWIVAMALLGPPLVEAGLLIPLAVYSLLLCVSLIAAYSTLAAGHFARPRAKLVATGMTFFVLCDITVGVGGAFANTALGDAADATTGLFYGPALVLLALSTRSPEPRTAP